MGFSSIDNLIYAMTTLGQQGTVDFQKTNSAGATSAAGRWHEMLTWTGVPAAMTLTGTAGTAFALNSSTVGALSSLPEGNVSAKTRHLLNSMLWTASATIAPASLILADFLVCYPSLVVTGTPTVITPTALTRYNTGAGVQACCVVATANGAAQPALTFTFAAAPDASSQTAVMTSPANSLPVSGIYLNNGQPMFPIPNGKTGVQSITSYTIGSGTTGTVSVLLYRPLIQIPICAQYLATERDCLYQLLSLPQIYDGACLGWLVQIGGAMTTLQTIGGRTQYAWA